MRGLSGETFLNEMSLVAEAVYNAFGPDKLNYELLGQGENVHMHWHIFPRRKGDTPVPGPCLEASEGGNVRRAVPAVR